MSDVRRVSAFAITMLVLLRVAIGWQLLYEGLWKFDTLSTPKPWSAAGYLKNAEGPLRDVFRNMAGDPDDLDWLNYDVVAARWDNWAKSAKQQFSLDQRQKDRLDRLLNGAEDYRAELDGLPDGVELEKAGGFVKKVIKFDPTAKRLIVSKYRLQPSEKDKLLKLVEGQTGPQVDKYKAAIKKVFDAASKTLSYKEKLAASVRGNPDVVGSEKLQYVGELEQYRGMLKKYNSDRAVAKTAFEWDHLNYTWKDLQSRRSALTGPIKAMEKEFHEKALSQIGAAQLKRGPVPEPWTALRISNVLTIIGLVALGICLIIGLFTRFSALMAAFMVFSFYMVWPPFPGVPVAPGPEHSFIVNKNLIEVFALIAIAATSSGIWFGLDGIVDKLRKSLFNKA